MSQVKERPILFSAPMVRAILEGRKTVTRRPFKDHQVPQWSPEDPEMGMGDQWHAVGQHHRRYGFMVSGATEAECAQELAKIGACHYGQRGDRLWVRETIECDEHASDSAVLSKYAADGEPVLYAGCEDPAYNGTVAHWDYPRRVRPSIHMPRWASRILLEITDVRVERLQAGDGETPAESRYVAEGIHRIHHGDGAHYFHPFKSEPGPGNWADPFGAWRELWVSINGADSWNANPWVWVVEFKQVTP